MRSLATHTGSSLPKLYGFKSIKAERTLEFKEAGLGVPVCIRLM